MMDVDRCEESVQRSPGSPSLEKKPRTSGSSRFDSSLGLLTKKFLKFMRHADNGEVDLNIAAQELGVQKRRLYDITNVLEGVGLLEKKSKNVIILKKRDQVQPKQTFEDLSSTRSELQALLEEETKLDSDISQMQVSLKAITSGEANSAYSFVTFEDLKEIPELDGHCLIAIKAPPGTELKIPDSNDFPESAGKRYQIILESPGGPIDCFWINHKDENQFTESSEREELDDSASETSIGWLLHNDSSEKEIARLADSAELEPSIYLQTGDSKAALEKGVSDYFAADDWPEAISVAGAPEEQIS